MVIKFSDTEEIKANNGTIWDYPISKDIGVSYQALNSRGPETGQYLNKVCHEIYFIIKGSATFIIDGESHQVEAKDIVIIPENTPHYIKTTDLTYITITRPDWYPEQYQEVE